MTDIEKLVLEMIVEEGVATTREIAEELELHPEIARRIVNGLRDDGFIQAAE